MNLLRHLPQNAGTLSQCIPARPGGQTGGESNERMSAAALRQSGAIEATALDLWQQLINQRGLSTLSSLQLLRVARTIADPNDRTSIDRNAVAEASCFRCTDLLKQPGSQ